MYSSFVYDMFREFVRVFIIARAIVVLTIALTVLVLACPVALLLGIAVWKAFIIALTAIGGTFWAMK